MLRILIFLISISVFSQTQFTGKIIDIKSKQPLLGASIYIPNTSIGTSTDIDGKFVLVVPTRNIEIVVSYVGYNTINVKLDLTEINEFSKTIMMREKSNQLDEVIVTKQKIDEEWRRQFKLFKYHFIGNSTVAEKVEILNKEDIFFTEVKDSTSYSLQAQSNKPLIIINKKLGYKLTYDLIEFSVFRSNDNPQKSVYYGYSFFEDIIEKEKLNYKKTIINRQKAYNGSLNHFIKSVYQNKIIENGFVVNEFILKENPEYPSKERLTYLKNEAKKTGNYDSLRNLPNKFQKIIGREYSKQNFVIGLDEKQYMSFKNSIQIKYNEECDKNYKTKFDFQLSYISLTEKVEIFENGNFYNPLHMIIYDYMSWKKMGDALPYDYEP